jgi:hypothetical protein
VDAIKEIKAKFGTLNVVKKRQVFQEISKEFGGCDPATLNEMIGVYLRERGLLSATFFASENEGSAVLYQVGSIDQLAKADPKLAQLCDDAKIAMQQPRETYTPFPGDLFD